MVLFSHASLAFPIALDGQKTGSVLYGSLFCQHDIQLLFQLYLEFSFHQPGFAGRFHIPPELCRPSLSVHLLVRRVYSRTFLRRLQLAQNVMDLWSISSVALPQQACSPLIMASCTIKATMPCLQYSPIHQLSPVGMIHTLSTMLFCLYWWQCCPVPHVVDKVFSLLRLFLSHLPVHPLFRDCSPGWPVITISSCAASISSPSTA